MRLRCQGGPADGWHEELHYDPGERIGVMEPLAAIGVRLGRWMLVPAQMTGASVYARDRRHVVRGGVRVYVPEEAS